jgi:hypothetical protein
MQKKNSSYFEKFMPVTLYLDDLEEIIGYLKNVADNIFIETDEYEYKSLDELLSNTDCETIYDLELASGDQKVNILTKITLNLETNRILLYRSDNEERLRGGFEKIKDVLKERERTYLRYLLIPWSVNATLIGLGLFVMKFWFYLPPFVSPIAIFIMLVGCIGLVWYLVREKNKYSIIVLKRRSNQISFWKRYKDQIWLLVIGAIVGSVVTIITTYVSNLLSK